MKDYYLIIGLTSSATQDEIKAAYRSKIRFYHPDHWHDDPGMSKEAEERTKELNEAYHVLSDPTRRADYNRRWQPPSAAARPPRPAQPKPRSTTDTEAARQRAESAERARQEELRKRHAAEAARQKAEAAERAREEEVRKRQAAGAARQKAEAAERARQEELRNRHAADAARQEELRKRQAAEAARQKAEVAEGVQREELRKRQAAEAVERARFDGKELSMAQLSPVIGIIIVGLVIIEFIMRSGQLTILQGLPLLSFALALTFCSSVAWLYFLYSRLDVVGKKQSIAKRYRQHNSQMRQTANQKGQVTKALDNLRVQEDSEIKKLEDNFISAYLRSGLAQIMLRSDDIPGIGPVLIERLIRSGVRTAADITHARVTSIYGIGDQKASSLVRWRRSLEEMLTRQARISIPTQLRLEISQIKGKYLPQRESLLRKLNSLEQLLKHQEVTKDRLQTQLQGYSEITFLNYFKKIVLRQGTDIARHIRQDEGLNEHEAKAAYAPRSQPAPEVHPTPQRKNPRVPTQVWAVVALSLLASVVILWPAWPVALGWLESRAATESPTNVLNANRVAETIIRNADWIPVISEFDHVKMSLVPKGCFMMGSDDGDETSTPIHKICFEQPFWIDLTEVTNSQYGSVGCTNNSSVPNQPRNCVNWTHAAAYCSKRGARLPTEAEWEYAARGPDGLTYPWGNTYDDDYIVDSTRSAWRTLLVGSKPAGASWVGALDLSGNVGEWVADWAGPYASIAQTHPSGPSSGTFRVIRGGPWYETMYSQRAFRRWSELPEKGNESLGFRCARDY